MAETDSKATFNQSAKVKIRERYQNRCAICLARLPTSGRHCAHLFKSAGIGPKQVLRAEDLGILVPGYRCSSADNGYLLCPTCHVAYFTPNYIALSPPIPVLQYIVNYLEVSTDALPLHQVLHLMFQAAEGHNVDLPDVTPFLPFMGLYTIVSLDPKEVEGMILATHHQQALSLVLTNEVAPENTPPTTPDVAQISGMQKLPKTHIPATLDIIPFSSSDPEFLESRYWHLPIISSVILAMLLERLPPTITCEEVRLARAIIGHLYLRSARNIEPLLDSGAGSNAGSSDGLGSGGDSGSGGAGSGKPGGGHSGSGGPSGGDSGGGEPSAGEPRGGDSGSGRACGGPNDHMEPSGSIGSRVAKRKREQSNQLESVQSEGSTSSKGNNDDNANILYGYGGKQEDWEFGPDFSSNSIIFAASGQMLVGPMCRPDLGPPES